MEQRQKDAVYGYVRLEYGESFIKEIIGIIYQFYLIRIESNILNSEEKISLMDLLFNTLQKQEENQQMKSIDTKLLYRASEHAYDSRKFHELCDEKGATITIIHNEHNHIFGGYISKSWPKEMGWLADSNAFLFMVRPKCKCFPLQKEYKNHYEVIYSHSSYGPVFGAGCDIYIDDENNQQVGGGGISCSFTQTSKEMCGGNVEHESHNHTYKVLDYEVFGIQID